MLSCYNLFTILQLIIILYKRQEEYRYGKKIFPIE